MKEIQQVIVTRSAEDIGSEMASCMDKFARSFEASARRWELVVYPSLLAFVILAAYGFFLIYTLTGDIARVAHSMENVVLSMQEVSSSINSVSGNISLISTNLTDIAGDMDTGSEDMNELLVKMDSINQSITVMSVPMHHIRDDMGRINKSLYTATGPMNMVGGMFPF